MKELARSRINDNRITIPPNIMDRLLLEDQDKISFFENRGRIIIRKYREDSSTQEQVKEVKDSDFKIEFEAGSSSTQTFPFNPLDPAVQEKFKSVVKDLLENEDAQEMLRKTAEDFSKGFGKMFEGVLPQSETIDLEEIEPDHDEDSSRREKRTDSSRKKRIDDNEDEEEFKIDIE